MPIMIKKVSFWVKVDKIKENIKNTYLLILRYFNFLTSWLVCFCLKCILHNFGSPNFWSLFLLVKVARSLLQNECLTEIISSPVTWALSRKLGLYWSQFFFLCFSLGKYNNNKDFLWSRLPSFTYWNYYQSFLIKAKISHTFVYPRF